MPENCRHWQGLLAEHILASTSHNPDQPMADDLAEHVAGCAECQAVAADFRSAAAALASTTAPHAALPVVAPPGLGARITSRVDRERHRRDRRRRVIAVGAAAAILSVTVWAVAARDSDTTRVAGERVTLVAGGMRGDATLQAQTWGTQIELTATGLTPGQRYVVWLERADGTRVPAGTFMGVRSSTITAVLGAALASSEAVAIGISDTDGAVVVRAALS